MTRLQGKDLAPETSPEVEKLSIDETRLNG